jgi:hypothetical protein
MRTFTSLISAMVLIAFTAATTFAWSECPPPPPCKTSKNAPCGSDVTSTTTTTTTTTIAPVSPVAAVIPPPAVVAPAPVPPPAPVAPPPPAPVAAVVPVVAAPPAGSSSTRTEVCVYTVEDTSLLVELHGVNDANRWIAEHSNRPGVPNDFVPAAGQMCGVTLTSLVQARAPAPLVSVPVSMPVKTPASPPESVAPSVPPIVEIQTPPVEEVQPPSEDIPEALPKPEALPDAGDGSFANELSP